MKLPNLFGCWKILAASLRFWGRAFGILKDDDTPTEIANYLFSKNGKDQF